MSINPDQMTGINHRLGDVFKVLMGTEMKRLGWQQHHADISATAAENVLSSTFSRALDVRCILGPLEHDSGIQAITRILNGGQAYVDDFALSCAKTMWDNISHTHAMLDHGIPPYDLVLQSVKERLHKWKGAQQYRNRMSAASDDSSRAEEDDDNGSGATSEENLMNSLDTSVEGPMAVSSSPAQYISGVRSRCESTVTSPGSELSDRNEDCERRTSPLSIGGCPDLSERPVVDGRGFSDREASQQCDPKQIIGEDQVPEDNQVRAEDQELDDDHLYANTIKLVEEGISAIIRETKWDCIRTTNELTEELFEELTALQDAQHWVRLFGRDIMEGKDPEHLLQLHKSNDQVSLLRSVEAIQTNWEELSTMARNSWRNHINCLSKESKEQNRLQIQGEAASTELCKGLRAVLEFMSQNHTSNDGGTKPTVKDYGASIEEQWKLVMSLYEEQDRLSEEWCTVPSDVSRPESAGSISPPTMEDTS